MGYWVDKIKPMKGAEVKTGDSSVAFREIKPGELSDADMYFHNFEVINRFTRFVLSVAFYPPPEAEIVISVLCHHCGNLVGLERESNQPPFCATCGRFSNVLLPCVDVSLFRDLDNAQSVGELQAWFECLGADPLEAVLCASQLLDYVSSLPSSGLYTPPPLSF